MIAEAVVPQEDYKQKTEEILQRYSAAHPAQHYAVGLATSIVHNPFSTFQLVRSGISEQLFRSYQQKVLKLEPSLKESEVGAKKVTNIILSCQILQILLGKNINIPGTIIHLSILYWLTDEILDNKEFDFQSKKKFSDALRKLINSGGKSLRSVDFTNESNDDNIKLNNQLSLIQKHIKAFFNIFFESRIESLDYDKQVFDAISALNEAQNQCTFVQSIAFYEENIDKKKNNPVELFNEAEIMANAKNKGARSFELYSLLLAPDIKEKTLADMKKLGEIYQLADDINDLIEDMTSNIVTPAIISLMKIKPGPISKEELRKVVPKLTDTELEKEISTIHLNNFIEFKICFALMRNETEKITYLDIPSFYKHCFDVLTQVQQIFAELKKNKNGIHWTLLHLLESKMIFDVEDGIKKVQEFFKLDLAESPVAKPSH